MAEATQRPNYPFHTPQGLERRLELRSQLVDVRMLHSVIAFVISLEPLLLLLHADRSFRR